MDWDSLNTFAYASYQKAQAERESAHRSQQKGDAGHEKVGVGFVTFVSLSGLAALSIWVLLFAG